MIAPNKIEDEAVRYTVNYLVCMVVEQHEIDRTSNDERKSKSKARGADFRKAQTAVFKAKVIHCELCVSISHKWLKEKDNIIAAATQKHKKLFKKQRPSLKYIELKEACGRDCGINFNWLWSKARSIYRKQMNDETIVVRKHIITTFLRRYNVRMRSRQRNRKKPKEAYREGLMKWHSITREHLIRTGGGSEIYDPKWGRFTPSQCFNVDQTPMPFVVDQKRT